MLERPWVVVVPFVLPGEVICAHVYRHARMHSFADLLSIEVPNSELCDMNRVQCKYFGTCTGCQYQVKIFLSIRAELNHIGKRVVMDIEVWIQASQV